MLRCYIRPSRYGSFFDCKAKRRLPLKGIFRRRRARTDATAEQKELTSLYGMVTGIPKKPIVTTADSFRLDSGFVRGVISVFVTGIWRVSSEFSDAHENGLKCVGIRIYVARSHSSEGMRASRATIPSQKSFTALATAINLRKHQSPALRLSQAPIGINAVE